MRLFISINFPEEVKKEILKIQSLLPEFEGKKIEKENLHLTLKFLGEVDENFLNEIKNALGTIEFPEFEASLGTLGLFHEREIRILWAGVSGCERLQKEVDASLKMLFKKEERFMGHLTIARVKKIRDKKFFLREFKKILFPKISFRIKDFYLMESRLTAKGPTYLIIKKYPLKIS